MIQHSEVRWYKFKKPDKKRPVLILTRNSIIEYLNEVTIAPITTTIREIPSEMVLSPKDGMPEICAVNLDHIQTVQKNKIGKLITTLNKVQMRLVKQALIFALDLNN